MQSRVQEVRCVPVLECRNWVRQCPSLVQH